MTFLSEPVLAVALLEVLVGLYLLTKAADRFVEGAVSVAAALRVSPIVIGAVIVGFGTSAPELLVSGIAANGGRLDVAVGNVVGSNMANLTLVLGAAALFVPLLVSRPILAREAPLSVAAVLAFAVCTIGGLARYEGVLLLVALALALGWIISGGLNTEDVVPDSPGGAGPAMLRTVGGLVGTVVGAQLLVWGAVAIAESLGISGGLVGVTLVAIGTSLPELVTAVVAARKGETELILGNLLGSNLFNSLAVGGVIALLGAGPIVDRSLAVVGVGGMSLIAVAAWSFMVVRKRVSKPEAVALLAAWFGSVVLLAGDPMESALGFVGWR